MLSHYKSRKNQILFVFCFLSLILNSCGFHLRGHIPLPMQLRRIYVESNTPFDPLIQQLKSGLKDMNVTVLNSPQDALVLHIISQQITHGLGNISANTNTRQYTIFYSLNFELYSHTQHRIIYPNTISTSRNLIINNNQILGSSSEEQTLIQEMRQTLIQMIAMRLSAYNTTKQLV